jgi:hypothetical protein
MTLLLALWLCLLWSQLLVVYLLLLAIERCLAAILAAPAYHSNDFRELMVGKHLLNGCLVMGWRSLPPSPFPPCVCT